MFICVEHEKSLITLGLGLLSNCMNASHHPSHHSAFKCLNPILPEDRTIKTIWDMTCDFQQCGILTSVDSHEPVQPLKTPNDVQSIAYICNSHRIFKRLAKALTRLRVCAGWSEALIVAQCWKSHALAHINTLFAESRNMIQDYWNNP